MEVFVRRIPTSAVVLAVVVAVAAPCRGVLAQNGVRRVTMAEALAAFASNSLELRIARAEAEAAIGTARQYRSYTNPAFSLAHESLGSSNDEYWETIAGVVQQLEWPGRTASRSRVAAHTSAGAAATFRADSVRLAFEVREAYVTVWLAEKIEESRRDVADEIQLVAEAADMRLAAGDISSYEARRLHLVVAQAERETSQAAIEARAARRRLALLIAPDAGLHEAGPAAELTGLPPAITPEVALAALGARPDLQAAARDLDAAKARSRFAMAAWVPDPTLGLGYKHQRGGLSGAALTVDVPMPLFDRGAGDRYGASARETAATYQLEFVRRLAEIDLMAASDLYASSRANLEATGDELLAYADLVLSAARAAYADGQVGQPGLVDAANIYRDTRIAAFSLRAETWIAYYDLLRAMARVPADES